MCVRAEASALGYVRRHYSTSKLMLPLKIESKFSVVKPVQGASLVEVKLPSKVSEHSQYCQGTLIKSLMQQQW